MLFRSINDSVRVNRSDIRLIEVERVLKRKFSIKCIESSNTQGKYRIYRMARLYGAPVPFPNPEISVFLDISNRETIIKYKFLSKDYLLLLFPLISLVVYLLGPSKALAPDLSIFTKSIMPLSVTALFWVAISLDSVYFNRLIKKQISQNV